MMAQHLTVNYSSIDQIVAAHMWGVISALQDVNEFLHIYRLERPEPGLEEKANSTASLICNLLLSSWCLPVSARVRQGAVGSTQGWVGGPGEVKGFGKLLTTYRH